jgi:hypothetical protein
MVDGERYVSQSGHIFDQLISSQVYDMDPVRTVRLNAFVAEQFQAAENAIGPENFQRLCLSIADPTVLKQIQDELL